VRAVFARHKRRPQCECAPTAPTLDETARRVSKGRAALKGSYLCRDTATGARLLQTPTSWLNMIVWF